MGRPGSPGLPGPKVGKVCMHLMHYGMAMFALNISSDRIPIRRRCGCREKKYNVS